MDKKRLDQPARICLRYVRLLSSTSMYQRKLEKNVLAQVFFFILFFFVCRIDTSGDQLMSYDEMVKFVSIGVNFAIYISHNWIKYFFF